MQLTKLASFSDGSIGGNPAGVHISDKLPSAEQMQAIAAEVGYSETAFAEPSGDDWRVRYFAPETEVPFCGHATIALGAALAKNIGTGVYKLQLNEANITVEGFMQGGEYSAALQSPTTSSKPASAEVVNEALQLFGYQHSDLNNAIPPAFANAGAEFLIIGLNSRQTLATMRYELDAGREFMRRIKVVTVMFAFAETDQYFHSRNAFASGGVLEDPATGAASAAFAGYLRDIHWPHNNLISIVQGEDMGSRSLIRAELDDEPHSSIRVSGSVRAIES